MLRFFGYFRGISLKHRCVHVASTGAIIEIDHAFWHAARAVLSLYVYAITLSVKQRLTRFITRAAPSCTLGFYPQNPGPWFNIWSAVRLANLKTASDLMSVDYVFIFEDKTYAQYDADFAKNPNAITLNLRVNDISKKRVADVFETVFGYPIDIDPTAYVGVGIMKSNTNGTHDGVIMSFPISAEQVSPSHVYQRLVDSTFTKETSEDLRVAYVLGEIALVYHKHKPLHDRFGMQYLSVDVKAPLDVFSPNETALIVEFCEAMGLDFGSVDVMRDKHDGQIYIVDVNKTCMPVLSLPLKTQIKSQKIIAAALTQGLTRLAQL